MNRQQFKAKTIIITGATAGIGRSLAIQLAELGAHVVLAARNLERLNEVAAECQKKQAKVLVVQTDVAKKTDCQHLIEQTVNTFGGIDILINNAGVSMWALFDEITDVSMLETIMQVNFFGSLYCTHYALPYLKKSKGLIVGVSSTIGKVPIPTRSGYAASKFAMRGFFDVLRNELEDDGVGVTMIYPGFIATEVRERALGSDGKPLGKSPLNESRGMSADACAKGIIKAMRKRQRACNLPMDAKIIIFLNTFFPVLTAKLTKKIMTSQAAHK
ncbi:MAG: SDR family oxidoreductase [Coxiellaceae bacterium]|nr:SDR family oxidoreductase [Coxiellaceae bacterium]